MRGARAVTVRMRDGIAAKDIEPSYTAMSSCVADGFAALWH
jgi:hypothetical protein